MSTVFSSSFHFKRTPSQEEQNSIFRPAKISSMASLVMMPFSKIKKFGVASVYHFNKNP
jgi:hypothetical protein